MPNIFEKKPSEELIKRFCKKIEEYLVLQQLKIKIELLDEPLCIPTTYGEKEGGIYFWINRCMIETPETGKNIEVELIYKGINDDITDMQIWCEAAHIQEQLYKYLGKDKGLPQDGNIFWRLWDFLPTQQNND